MTTDTIVLSIRLMGVPPGSGGYSEWLKVIHAINRARPGSIGAPLSTYAQSGGRLFEEYPEFRVILKDEITNYVQAKTEAAAKLLHDAALEVTGRDFGPDGFPR